MAIKDTQRVGVFSESTVSKEVMGFLVLVGPWE